jgi:hypothetical protein
MEEEKVYTSKIEIKHEWTPCFFSASWMIRIFVNDKIFLESHGKETEWTKEEIAAWVKDALLENWSILTQKDVNVYKEYEKWFGNLF